jgi:hypothetical protein
VRAGHFVAEECVYGGGGDRCPFYLFHDDDDDDGDDDCVEEGKVTRMTTRRTRRTESVNLHSIRNEDSVRGDALNDDDGVHEEDVLA